ncbi:16S rRNA (cytosine(1402)-N(4))-methyltransferase, partial [bacterium]|nr:16S rRNA (cytosine(1402)-N(4))-methyltransferase [bacterium]
MKYIHKPVLVKEVLKYLNLESNYNVIDGTI